MTLLTLREIFLAIGLCALMGCYPATQKSDVVLDSNGISVVKLAAVEHECVYSWGTGFFMEYHGKVYLITAWHVVDSGGKIELHYGNIRLKARLGQARRVGQTDAAIIPIYELKFAVKPFRPVEATLPGGAGCEAVGFPGFDGLTRMKGNVSAYHLHTTCRMEHGMSGGPTLRNGMVIGINSAISVITDTLSGQMRFGGGHVPVQCILRELD